MVGSHSVRDDRTPSQVCGAETAHARSGCNRVAWRFPRRRHLPVSHPALPGTPEASWLPAPRAIHSPPSSWSSLQLAAPGAGWGGVRVGGDQPGGRRGNAGRERRSQAGKRAEAGRGWDGAGSVEAAGEATGWAGERNARGGGSGRGVPGCGPRQGAGDPAPRRTGAVVRVRPRSQRALQPLPFPSISRSLPHLAAPSPRAHRAGGAGPALGRDASLTGRSPRTALAWSVTRTLPFHLLEWTRGPQPLWWEDNPRHAWGGAGT